MLQLYAYSVYIAYSVRIVNKLSFLRINAFINC